MKRIKLNCGQGRTTASLVRKNKKLKDALRFLTLNCEHWLEYSVLDLLEGKSRVNEALKKAKKIVYKRLESKTCK